MPPAKDPFIRDSTPNFDNMVMRADERCTPDPAHPVSAPIRIAVHLRTRVKLEPRPAV